MQMNSQRIPDEPRQMGLFGATGVGVGAIVGGGILALAGVALATTGPSAVVAFALNGLIAVLTALSFSEMASKFPESGGTYTFARKVLSIEAAFSVGWVVWFASITAAALYAMGFAYFGLIFVNQVWVSLAPPAPVWLQSEGTELIVAVLATGVVAGGLMWRPTAGGHWINVTKVLVFAVLILGGVWAASQREVAELQARLRPFFAAGGVGFVQAMGYTFIALQGFDLIAAVGGEVRSPRRNVPLAMLLSLAIALAVYLPLLLVVTTVGMEGPQSVVEMAQEQPEGLVAAAAEHYLGPVGFWLVIVAGVLAMFSALQANVFAASRIAKTMAVDGTLPAMLRWVSVGRHTPYVAVAVTAGLAVAVLLVVSDVAAAGAASSLIFLVSFALAHWTAILVRQRSVDQPPSFRTPWFPLVPVVGGLACLILAVFQSLVVPSAGIVAGVWLAAGSAMFLTLFARRARVRDAVVTALDPELVQLRGRTPRVLVPVANPDNVASMLGLAHTLTPALVGQLTVFHAVGTPDGWDPGQDADAFQGCEQVVRQAVITAVRLGIRAETSIAAARDPVAEITRAANRSGCDLLVLGLSRISADDSGTRDEQLLSAARSDVVVLRAPAGWDVGQVQRVLVLVAGQGGHDELRARLLGSLVRTGPRLVTYLRVVPESSSREAIRLARREMTRLTANEMSADAEVVVHPSSDPIAATVQFADAADLIVLGVQRVGKRRLFGHFTRQVAIRSPCPMVVISHR